jgi:hypothetical protein
LYAIKESENYGFYHLDGSFAFGEYATVETLFDDRHHAIVSDDGVEYYLINSKGEQVGDLKYKKVYSHDEGYLVVSDDDNRTVLTSDGVQVADANYSEATNHTIAVDHDIWALKLSKHKYDVVDTTSKQPVILSDVYIDNFYVNYFTVHNENDGYDYYTYDGYKFFSTKE